MGGVQSITKQALHGLSGQSTVSVQEAIHMIDTQELVLFSDCITHISLQQGTVTKIRMARNPRT